MADEDLEALRAEVAVWLAGHWDGDQPGPGYSAGVVDAGYAVPTWPTRWFGRGLSTAAARVVTAEFARVRAPGAGQDVSNLPANVIFVHGTDEQRERFLRPLLCHEIRWCLLYSEPGAGSDLAAVQTRATRAGDDWVVSGQKVWTSDARRAEYAMLLARTDWDVPKHRGLTFFWFPMRQPGVEVRPIRQITGDAHFNEVFIDDARVPDANRLGAVGEGWPTLQTALAYERLLMGSSQEIMGSIVGIDADPDSPPDAPGGAGHAAGLVRHAPADLVALARSRGVAGDARIRDRIVELFVLRAVNHLTNQRARENRGGPSSPTASVGKLAMSRILHTGARLKSAIIGTEAMLLDADHPPARAANLESMTAYVNSIGGGTDEIQRNIIGERVLGLPREPQVDRDVPFRDVLKSPSRRPFG